MNEIKMNEIAEKCSLLCDKVNRGEELSDEEIQFVKEAIEIYSDMFSKSIQYMIKTTAKIAKALGKICKKIAKTTAKTAKALGKIYEEIGDDDIKRISQMPEEERENEIKKLLNQEDK